MGSKQVVPQKRVSKVEHDLQLKIEELEKTNARLDRDKRKAEEALVKLKDDSLSMASDYKSRIESMKIELEAALSSSEMSVQESAVSRKQLDDLRTDHGIRFKECRESLRSTLLVTIPGALKLLDDYAEATGDAPPQMLIDVYKLIEKARDDLNNIKL
jgi:hypothetical protein